MNTGLAKLIPLGLVYWRAGRGYCATMFDTGQMPSGAEALFHGCFEAPLSVFNAARRLPSRNAPGWILQCTIEGFQGATAPGDRSIVGSKTCTPHDDALRRALLGLQLCGGGVNGSVRPRGIEIDDPAEPGDQVPVDWIRKREWLKSACGPVDG